MTSCLAKGSHFIDGHGRCMWFDQSIDMLVLVQSKLLTCLLCMFKSVPATELGNAGFIFFLEGASLLRYPILASGSKVKRNHVLLVLAKADLRPWSDRGLVVLSPRALLDTFRHRMGLVDSPFCSKRFSFSFLVPEVREVLLIKDCKSTTGHGQACRAFSR